jgi:hypothetical protein
MQNKIQVEVAVKFNSGATIQLAPDQHEAVVGFINHMLFGGVVKTETKEKRKYTKRRILNRWSQEEIQMVREAMEQPAGKLIREAYKKVARETRRSRSAITQKATELRRGDKVKITNGYQPLHSLAGLLS